MNDGVPIDNDFKPDRDYVYDMFIEYFNNPEMAKIKNENGLSMYLTKTYCLTSTTCRYIIVFVPQNNSPLGSSEYLKDLKWVSLQTRTLPDSEYSSVDTVHGYQPVAQGGLTAIINRTKIDDTASTYSCETLPIIITLLHTEKNTKEAYQNKGNVINALETFQTIITFDK